MENISVGAKAKGENVEDHVISNEERNLIPGGERSLVARLARDDNKTRIPHGAAGVQDFEPRLLGMKTRHGEHFMIGQCLGGGQVFFCRHQPSFGQIFILRFGHKKQHLP